ncbi:Replication termination factor 2 [Coemansia sp. BCRC 34301]|nr:Replication termination factor 2 [Coemansia sp. BCRC 34301]
MGNDGGSIPRRNEMVREKKKDEKADRKNQAIALNYFCALSKQPLQEPIVSDELGRLYNRESVLEYLLDRSAFGDGHSICNNIQSLKDVKALKATPNPAFSKEQSNGKSLSSILSYDEQPTARFVCPITMKEMNGNSGFEFIWSCGCVFSAQARRELPDSTTCIVCDRPFVAEDVIPINSVDPAILDALGERMAARKRDREDRKKLKSKAKPKNGKRKHEDSGTADNSIALPTNKSSVKAAKTQMTEA